jgi:hypothetical protein
MPAPAEVIDGVIRACQLAVDANRRTPTRQGNVIVLADDVMFTADVHGQRLNFNKLCRLADLVSHPRRHLVLQEVCHGGPPYPNGWGCMSHLLLEDVIQLKLQFPQQVHFLLSNHELAEVIDHPIAKGGRILNLQFRAGMQEIYGAAAETVRAAYCEFIASCPLAVRAANGLFACHGSPAEVDQDGLNLEVFQRPLTMEDFRQGGAAFRIVWGRDFRAENAEAFAKLVEAEVLIHGHEPCSRGFRVPNSRQLILDCSGPRACYLLLPMREPQRHAEVIRRVLRLYENRHSK